MNPSRRGIVRIASLALTSVTLCGYLFIAPRARGRSDLAAATAGDVFVQGPGVRPQLFFACELNTPELQSLFANRAIISDLKELHAGVGLASNDMSRARAQIVRKLNDAGIPTIASIDLPMEQGYYVNASNAPEADARFTAFEKWTRDNGLKWVAVGLDIEPTMNEFMKVRDHKLDLAMTLLKRSFDGARVERAREAYSALISRIQSDGYAAQTYQMFFMADERKVHSTVAERLFGIVDVKPVVAGWLERVPEPLRTYNREVLMAYSSFNHAAGGAVVWSFGQDAQAIAIGSTAGSDDPAVDAKFGPLNWDEFSRDLILASHFSQLVGVYSLEGCVRQGFLPRIRTIDWGTTVTISSASIHRVTRFRHTIEVVFWTASHVVYILVALVLIIIALIWRRRSRRAMRTSVAEGAIAGSR